MLPLINLKAGELFSFEAVSSSENLMPEAASAIEGEFAELLQSSVASEFSSLVPSGELVPESGNHLPPEPPLPVVDMPISPTNLQTFPGATALVETDALPHGDTMLEQMLGESSRQYDGIQISNAQSLANSDAIPSASETALLEAGPGVQVAADTAELQSGDGLLVQTNPAPILNAGSTNAGLTIAESTVTGSTVTGPTVTGIDNAITNSRNTEPLVRNLERPLAANEPQQARSANVQLAASIEPGTPNPLAGQIEPRLNAVAEHLRHQRSRTPVTTESSSILRGGDEQPRILGEEIAALPPRPVATMSSTSTFVTPEPPIQVDTGPRFSSDLAAALGRQPQAAIPATVSTTIELPVQQPGWDNALADRVTLMANGKLQNAEIRLTPAELGPLRVQLVIDDGTANVSFHAQHAHTREAIEQALPRLREMLAENGLQLGQASVGDDGVNQRGRDGTENARPQSAVANDAHDDSDAPEKRQAQRQLDGLVDTFA